MEGNFARIDNTESEHESIQLSRICVENGSIFFIFLRFLKKRSGNDFISTTYMSSHLQKNPQLYDFSLGIVLKAQWIVFRPNSAIKPNA